VNGADGLIWETGWMGGTGFLRKSRMYQRRSRQQPPKKQAMNNSIACFQKKEIMKKLRIDGFSESGRFYLEL
jgi:hypothetical protein